MNVTIVDYNSGNISSVINSFKEAGKDKVNIEVTSDLNKIKLSDKIVLPGQGSFKSCVEALNGINGLVEALNEFANSFSASTKPFIPFNASTQLLNDPCPGKTILSLNLILFKSEVTSILTLSLPASLKEFITELIFPEL